MSESVSYSKLVFDGRTNRRHCKQKPGENESDDTFFPFLFSYYQEWETSPSGGRGGGGVGRREGDGAGESGLKMVSRGMTERRANDEGKLRGGGKGAHGGETGGRGRGGGGGELDDNNGQSRLRMVSRGMEERRGNDEGKIRGGGKGREGGETRGGEGAGGGGKQAWDDEVTSELRTTSRGMSGRRRGEGEGEEGGGRGGRDEEGRFASREAGRVSPKKDERYGHPSGETEGEEKENRPRGRNGERGEEIGGRRENRGERLGEKGEGERDNAGLEIEAEEARKTGVKRNEKGIGRNEVGVKRSESRVEEGEETAKEKGSKLKRKKSGKGSKSSIRSAKSDSARKSKEFRTGFSGTDFTTEGTSP